MKKIAKFEKVSLAQFTEAWREQLGTEDGAESALAAIPMPRRATSGSAGYDFSLPYDLELKPGDTAKIPTGIRAKIAEGWVLMIYPRSGLGFKYRMQLNNTVGIIDSDYYKSDNEGHIFIKITNDTNEGKTISLKSGDCFAQGIFTEFGVVENDDADGVRNGGFGSTSKN